ncbi:MAG: hypothetical protein IJQ57_04680 [Synergistaceae bacterium]|nr:hypothetical protein [Synergistaceae bacterium]
MKYSFNKVEYTYEQIVTPFLSAMLQAGVIPKDNGMIFEIDGKLHRFQVTDDKSGQLSGGYLLYDNGYCPAGYFQDWRRQIKQTWRYDTKQLTTEQRQQLREVTTDPQTRARMEAEQTAKRQEAQRQKENEQQQAIEKALSLYKSTPVVNPDSNPYLTAKNRHIYKLLEFQPAKLQPHEHNRALLIPLYSVIDGGFQSLQTIYLDENGQAQKRFFKGCPTTGIYYPFHAVKSYYTEEGGMYPPQLITNKTYENITLLAEGIFTAQAVWSILEYSFRVLACLTCGNLFNIAWTIKKRTPARKIIIMSDNDIRTERKEGYNPGIQKAKEIVNRGLACGFIAPAFSELTDGKEASDWEDFFNNRRQDFFTFERERGKLQTNILNLTRERN